MIKNEDLDETFVEDLDQKGVWVKRSKFRILDQESLLLLQGTPVLVTLEFLKRPVWRKYSKICF